MKGRAGAVKGWRVSCVDSSRESDQDRSEDLMTEEEEGSVDVGLDHDGIHGWTLRQFT